MSVKKWILSTSELDPKQAVAAEQVGYGLDVIPFISTVPIHDPATELVVDATLNQEMVVLFTSTAAIRVVAGRLRDTHPRWSLYCVGAQTAALAARCFPESVVTAVAATGSLLADVLLQNAGNSEVVFFCGDKRWPELPGKLRQAGVAVQELVVYQTLETPVKIEKKYDAILFYSPSGVSSYYQLNKPDAGTLLCAIGNTTASSLPSQGPNTVLISPHSRKQDVLQMAIDYLNKQTTDI